MSEPIDQAVLELIEVEVPWVKPYLSNSSVLRCIQLIACFDREKHALVADRAYEHAATVKEVTDLLKRACEKYCSTLSLHSHGDDKNPGL